MYFPHLSSYLSCQPIQYLDKGAAADGGRFVCSMGAEKTTLKRVWIKSCSFYFQLSEPVINDIKFDEELTAHLNGQIRVSSEVRKSICFRNNKKMTTICHFELNLFTH